MAAEPVVSAIGLRTPTFSSTMRIRPGRLGPCVQAIVDAHGGSVAATSDPGKSTTFRIRLPGFRPAAEDHAPAEVPEKIEIASA